MGRPRRDVPSTEALHPRAGDLDLQPVGEVVRRLQQEDRVAVASVARARPAIAALAELAASALGDGGRLIYVGAGTSGRLGLLDAAECPPTFGSAPRQVQAVIAGGRRALTRAVEGAEDDRAAGALQMVRLRVGPSDLVCGISASSTTPFVRAALTEAGRRGARVALVCCAPRPDVRGLDVVVALDTGPELIAGSTRLKAGTATKLVLNAVSTAAFVHLGSVHRGRMVSMKPTNSKLRRRAEAMVSEFTGLAAPAAGRLLRRGRTPAVAIAMHLTGLPAGQAAAALRDRSLRDLERSPQAQAPGQPVTGGSARAR